MSERVNMVMWCDHPGCEAEYETDVPAELPEWAKFETLTLRAARAGWQVDPVQRGRHSIDYCPDHGLYVPTATSAKELTDVPG